jgi:hypothetical protein
MGGFVSDITGKDSSPPPAPDYAGAATQTAAGNLEAARAAASANRVNQYTPYGSINYSQTPTYGVDGVLNKDAGWNLTTSLSPSQQRQFDQNNRINEGLGDVANTGLGFVRNALSNPLQGANPLTTTAGDPELLRKDVGDALYRNNTQYLDPQFEQSDKALESRLANQGVTPGSEAYKAAMLNQANARQQAYESARNSSTAGSVSAAQGLYGQKLSNANLTNSASAQDFAQRQALQQNPINILNSVRTGQQMNTATLPVQNNVAMQPATAGPDMLGAATASGQYAQGIYNADQARAGATMGGLGSLAMAGAMAPPGTFKFG